MEAHTHMRRPVLSIINDKKPTVQGGLFITFEGIDGSGKSVQAEALSKNLQQRGHSVILVRDPGGSAVSEHIRNILLDPRHQTMAPITELLLYEAARSQLVTELIRPSLDRGDIVVSDRFTDSTVAYQGYGRSLPIALIHDANQWACSNTFPHRTYILDIPWEDSLRRRLNASIDNDRMEKEQEHFYLRVRKGYQAIADKESHRVLMLDGTKTIESLEQEMLQDALNIIEGFQNKKTA